MTFADRIGITLMLVGIFGVASGRDVPMDWPPLIVFFAGAVLVMYGGEMLAEYHQAQRENDTD